VPTHRTLASLLVAVVVIAACDDAGTPFRPPPPASFQPVLIEQRGPVAIDFLTATPAVGSTVAGCGSAISGCAGRVEMQFLLRAHEPGHVLGVRAFLHAATNLRACLLAETGPFDLARGEVRTLSIAFDRFDDCGIPLTIATMAVVVEGTVEVASRRAWQVTYRFER
jgi:hypothetical protein